MKKITGNWAS